MVRGALGTIGGLLPETLLTIISDGQTATGISSKTAYGESLEADGERGNTTGRVLLDASKMTTPAKGSTISVNGNLAIVGNTAVDGTGGSLSIDFQYITEVE